MKRTLTLLLLFATLSLPGAAQDFNDWLGEFFGFPMPEIRKETKPFSFTGDLLMDWTFRNDEFLSSAPSGLVPGTMAGVRLTPFAGIRIDRGDGGVHRIMGGISLLKEFGGEPTSLDDVLMYYRYDNRFGKTDFSAFAGVFPRAKAHGVYDRLIFSDEVRFYDGNLEGLLLQFRRPRAFYEICLDWNGMYSPLRREEFNVFTYGEAAVSTSLKLGWEGIFHHYASSEVAKGVVDDHLLNPWICFDGAKMTRLQALTVKAGPVVSYQRDRRYPDVKLPWGLSLTTDIRNWGFGIRNFLYWGDTQMPYFYLLDSTGAMFGNNLYMRSLKATPDPGFDNGLADILSFYWAPRLGDFISARISFDLLFNARFDDNQLFNGYVGMDQLGTLVIDLEKLGKRKPAAPHSSRNHSIIL